MRAIELPRGIILTEQIGGAEVLEHSIRNRIREGWTGIIRGRQNSGEVRVEGHVSLLNGGPVLAHFSEGDLRGMEALDALREMFEDPQTRVTFHAEIDVQGLTEIWPEARLERLDLKLEEADVDQAVARQADADMRLGWWRRLTEQTVARDVPGLPEARPNARLKFPERTTGSTNHGGSGLRWGSACMIEGRIDDLAHIGKAAIQTNRDLLVITRRPLNQIAKGLLHGTVLRLTERAGDSNSTSPRPDRIRDTILHWLDSHWPGIVLLDGLEYSAGIHGSAQMLEALDGIVDRIRFEEHIFIATIDLNSWDQRDRHRLQATMDPLQSRDIQAIHHVFEDQPVRETQVVPSTQTIQETITNNELDQQVQSATLQHKKRHDTAEFVQERKIVSSAEQRRVDPTLMAGFLEDIADDDKAQQLHTSDIQIDEVPSQLIQPSINRAATKYPNEKENHDVEQQLKEIDEKHQMTTEKHKRDAPSHVAPVDPLGWEPSVLEHWSKVPSPPERVENTSINIREATREEFTLRLNKGVSSEKALSINKLEKGPKRATTNHGTKRRTVKLPTASNEPSPLTKAAVSRSKQQRGLEILHSKNVSHGATIPDAPNPLAVLPPKNESHGSILPKTPVSLEERPALSTKLSAIGMKRSKPKEFTGGPEAQVLPGRTQWDHAASRARTATVLDANPSAPPPKDRGKAIGLGGLRKGKEITLDKKVVDSALKANPAALPPRTIDREIGLKPMPKTLGVHHKRKETGDKVLDAAPEAPAPRVSKTKVGLSPMEEKKGVHLKKKKAVDTFRDDIEKEIEI